MGLLSAAALVVLVAMNYQTIRLKTVHYGKGTVLRLKSGNEPFGKVVGFEARHQFPTGNPSPAYAFQTTDQAGTIWISQRVVVNGMVPVEDRQGFRTARG
jgi:hypothetical protein